MKQTAVDWLIMQWMTQGTLFDSDMTKAKQMEKQQAINDYEAGLDNGFAEQDISAEQYYKEVYE